MIDRSHLLAAVISRLESQFSSKKDAANTVRTEATDAEARSENKYDTRSIETSYLARGQAMQVEGAAEDVLTLRGFTCPEDADKPSVNLGRLVEFEQSGLATWYFILPAAGGEEVELDGTVYSVVTPATPAGRALLGKQVGDTLALRPGAPKGTITNVF